MGRSKLVLSLLFYCFAVKYHEQKSYFPEKQTNRGVDLNIILKILSCITEKIAYKAYVDFCDGQYHWASVETEVKEFDSENKLVYEKEVSGRIWKYKYSGHKVVARDNGSSFVTTITNVFSVDNQRKIYTSEDRNGDVNEETWYEYNEQNKLIKTKTIDIYSAHSSAWTFVDYEYNQNGILEKTTESYETNGKKNEGDKTTFYNEKGLMTRLDEYIVTDKYTEYISTEFKYDDANNLISDLVERKILTTYEYDNENNKIRERHYDGSEVLFKTVSKKKGNLYIKKVYTYRHLGKKMAKPSL